MTDAERLAEAERELHLLRIGQKARVVVDQNGERVEFTLASVDRLAAYVDRLKRGEPRRPTTIQFATHKGV